MEQRGLLGLGRRSRRLLVVGAICFTSLTGVSLAAFTANTANGANSIAAAASFTSTCTKGASQVSADGPSAYWKLDDTSGTTMAAATGTSGTYTNGPLINQTPGAFAYAANRFVTFDGTDDFATVPHGTSVNIADTFTVEAWVKTTNTAAGTIFDKGLNSANVTIQANGQPVLAKEGVDDVAQASVSVNDGGWHHVVVTKSGTSSYVYVDGVDRTGTRKTQQTMAATTDPVYLGKTFYSSDFFKGGLDDVAIYTKVLTPAQVAAHYAAAAPCYRESVTGDSPVSFWRLGESNGSPVAFDSRTTNSGKYLNGTAGGQTGAISSDSNTAAGFDGSDDQISVADATALRSAGDMSLELWFKRSSLPGAGVRLAGKGSNFERNYGLMLLTDGKIAFQQCNSGCASNISLTSPAAPTANVWHHLVATVSGSTARLYIDGSQVATTTRPFASATTTTDPFTIGSASWSSVLTGQLDEVAFYSSALSAAQVSQHYAAGS